MKDKALAGKKILWVEDDMFLSDLMAKKLAKYDPTLFHAKNADEVFSVLGKEKPDLIVLDVLLPGLNGFEILKKVKTDAATKSIPVVLLSNLNQKSDIEKGAELGAKKFLVKALLTPDDILQEVGKVLGVA